MRLSSLSLALTRPRGGAGGGGGGGGGSSPAAVATAAYWLDSTQNVVGSAPVTSWTDRKLAKVFAASGSPQLITGPPPRIRLGGVPDCLSGSTMDAVNYAGGNPAAMTFAFRTRSSFNNAAILAYGGGSNHFTLGINAAGVLKASRSSDWSTNDAVDVAALATDTLYVATVLYTGSELVLRRNATGSGVISEVARVANSYSFGSSTGARVGGLADGANFSQSADAIQAVLFTSAYTLADVIAVENYFKSQIGI